MKFIGDQELESRILNSEGFLLVSFWETGSTACQHFRPEYKQLAESLHLNDGFNPPGGFSMVSLLVDENPSETESLGVTHVPTSLLFHKGKQIARWEGPYNALALADRIIEAVKKRV